MLVKRIVFITTVIFVLFSTIALSAVHAKPHLSSLCEENTHNCGELWEFLYWEKVPSLHINKIECNAENQLSIIIDIQPAQLPGDPWEDQWEAEATVYLDGEKTGIFNVRKPTHPTEHIDSYSPGTYTYVLPWVINESVIVKIVILAKGTVSSGGNIRFLFSDTYMEEYVEPNTVVTANAASNTSYDWLILLFVVSISLLILLIVLLLHKRDKKAIT